MSWLEHHRRFCVNRSNQTISVRAPVNDPQGPIVGTIRPGDFFRWEGVRLFGTWGADNRVEVHFRDATGRFTVGGFGFTAVQDQPNFYAPVANFRRLNVSWNGMTLNVFEIQNRPVELVNSNGILIQTLLLGTRIGVNGIGVMGTALFSHWIAHAVLRTPGEHLPEQWQWADVVNNQHGFVNTGLSIANRAETISIRTNLVP